jgi:hypothetical protein
VRLNPSVNHKEAKKSRPTFSNYFVTSDLFGLTLQEAEYVYISTEFRISSGKLDPFHSSIKKEEPRTRPTAGRCISLTSYSSVKEIKCSP